MDTGQEALEATGRTLDLEAFPECGKACITKLFQGEKLPADCVGGSVGGSQDSGMEFAGFSVRQEQLQGALDVTELNNTPSSPPF